MEGVVRPRGEVEESGAGGLAFLPGIWRSQGVRCSGSTRA